MFNNDSMWMTVYALYGAFQKDKHRVRSAYRSRRRRTEGGGGIDGVH
jgi:hypothetical protein